MVRAQAGKAASAEATAASTWDRDASGTEAIVSPLAAGAMFALYAVLTGATLSSIFFVYSGTSIATTFVMEARRTSSNAFARRARCRPQRRLKFSRPIFAVVLIVRWASCAKRRQM